LPFEKVVAISERMKKALGSEDCWYSIVKNGNLLGIKWLHYHEFNEPNNRNYTLMDAAASYGHLEIVRWLHSNSNEGCTHMAMDLAAGDGHLEVVKWLQHNRREGSTEWAMVLAARNGHLDVLK
jgi:hypothetical protein